MKKGGTWMSKLETCFVGSSNIIPREFWTLSSREIGGLGARRSVQFGESSVLTKLIRWHF